MSKKLVVIGGGAAGFFCAINAARQNPSLQVCILEKSNKVLSKVKISGGGRCNTTHACFEIDELVKKYPRGQHFLKKAFHWFNTKDTIAWFAERGVELKTEADGRMFPISNDSQTIIDCLLKEATKYKVAIQFQVDIKQVQITSNGSFQLVDSNHQIIAADFLCIATGGGPKMTMFDWLSNLGHPIKPPVPSLFTFNIPDKSLTQLMGLSIPQISLKIKGTKIVAEGPVLITHWGLSGPAVLKLSAWAARDLANLNYRFELQINWLHQYAEQDLRSDWLSIRNDQGSAKLEQKNPFGLPNRFWVYLIQKAGIPQDQRWSDLTAAHQNKLIQLLCSDTLLVTGKTTFKEEFVTCGGIDLAKIDANTLQSKIHPHLFFAGEILDIDGITGGFNFQNAWTTGWIAAKSIAHLSFNND